MGNGYIKVKKIPHNVGIKGLHLFGLFCMVIPMKGDCYESIII